MIPEHVFARTLRDLLAPVADLLGDPAVSEVMINGPGEVWFERGGRLARSDARFPSEAALLAAVRAIAQYAGRAVSEERPVLEARLPDGSRVEAVLPPAARGGITVAIRRFPDRRLGMEDLLRLGALTEDAAEALRLGVALERNVVVSGGTGSGKTSMLNALSGLVPDGERIVVIEDASEVRCAQPHVVYLEARPPDARGRGEVTIRQLLRATLRLRPDRIVIGEVRAGEALDLVQAMTSGHGGGLTTVHAACPAGALRRLETLALMSDVDLPLAALRDQVGSAVDLIVQVARLADGSRRVTHVSECAGYAHGEGYRLTDLYRFHHRGRDRRAGRVLGSLDPTGAPSALGAEAAARGLPLPPGLSPGVPAPRPDEDDREETIHEPHA